MTDALDLAAAVDRLRAGGVIAYPTDTVYGIAADAFTPAAARAVVAIKHVPADAVGVRDGSSVVCSSDLVYPRRATAATEIGRASCRERVCVIV